MDYIRFILLFIILSVGRGVSLNPHVETTPSVTLREGSKAMLLCGYERVAFAVYWYKNVTTSSTSSKELLVYLDLYYNEGKRNGPGLDDGYNVADDFALVINEVRQKDAGMFICEVSDFEEGAVYRNHTIVNIQGRGVSVGPLVETDQSVTLDEGSEALLQCRYDRAVFKVYWYKNDTTSSTPSKDLLVVLDVYYKKGARKGDGLNKGYYNITDDFSLVISEVRKRDAGVFICEVSDFEEGVVYRNDTKVTVQNTALMSMSEGNQSWMAGVISVCVIVGLLAIILGLVILAYKMNVLPSRVSQWIRELFCLRRTLKRREENEMGILLEEKDKLRSTLLETILSYSPGKATGIKLPDGVKDTVPNICLFGQTGAGKSTLINAVRFALTGDYSSTFCETSEGSSSGGVTFFRNKYQITETSFNLVDNRGMHAFSPALMNEIVAQVKGERGLDPDTKIEKNEEHECHCPVFVFDSTQIGKFDEVAFKFINTYYDTLKKYYGGSPMIVITHKDILEERNELTSVESKLRAINFPTENIWALENYTKEKCEKDVDKDIELLKFLLRALVICDHNINVLARRKTEKEADRQNRCLIS